MHTIVPAPEGRKDQSQFFNTSTNLKLPSLALLNTSGSHFSELQLSETSYINLNHNTFIDILLCINESNLLYIQIVLFHLSEVI